MQPRLPPVNCCLLHKACVLRHHREVNLVLPTLGEPWESEEEATVVSLGNRKGFRREETSEAEMGADGLHEAWEAGITEAEGGDT